MSSMKKRRIYYNPADDTRILKKRRIYYNPADDTRILYYKPNGYWQIESWYHRPAAPAAPISNLIWAAFDDVILGDTVAFILF